ncbi:MAG: co-chaperone DjlA [Gammaproteobacteria bacterium]|nr:co-chaperone DjlA [Gammaproteobacteria bacterium]
MPDKAGETRAMAWIGKVAGAVLGYAAARWPGAVIGAILGHQFDRGMAVRPGTGAPGGTSAVERQRVFFETTFMVMGHLAKVDGRVSEAEIDAARAVMQRMRLDEGQTRLAMEFFNTGKRADWPLLEQVGRLRSACGRHPQLLRLFLEIEVDLALAKGSVSAAERELLGRIADALGMNRLVIMHLEAILRARRAHGAAATPPSSEVKLADAYEVLGVDARASDREVKTAYRRLMNQHHPDKQAARGLPESMLGIAHERTREIRAAYELVREARGMR